MLQERVAKVCASRAGASSPGAQAAAAQVAAAPGSPPTPASTPAASPPASNSAGTLREILVGDLLAQRIQAKEQGVPASKPLANVHILTLHTLESGGTQVTKSHSVLLVVTWNSVYYSGGAVATFAMFDADGAVECSGYAYGYHGYVKDKDVGNEIGRDSSSAAARTAAYCPAT